MAAAICKGLAKNIAPNLGYSLNTTVASNQPFRFKKPSYRLFSQFQPINPLLGQHYDGSITQSRMLCSQYVINNKDIKEVMHHSTSFLLPSQHHRFEEVSSLNYALLVLNQPLPRFTPLLWDQAKVRTCADGGANRLFDQIPQYFPQQDLLDVRKRYTPDVIIGDLDSIRADVRDFYTNLGCDAIDESHDQDTTDLHKCINHLYNSTPESEISDLCILVTGALGGRFDHEAANINVLHHFSNLRIILLSDDCLIQLLPKTHHHEIHIESSVVGPHCGLIPLGGPALHTTTSGLQWNLNDTEMRIGGSISTSNLVSGDAVSVDSDADLIWTISIKKSC